MVLVPEVNEAAVKEPVLVIDGTAVILPIGDTRRPELMEKELEVDEIVVLVTFKVSPAPETVIEVAAIPVESMVTPAAVIEPAFKSPAVVIDGKAVTAPKAPIVRPELIMPTPAARPE